MLRGLRRKATSALIAHEASSPYSAVRTEHQRQQSVGRRWVNGIANSERGVRELVKKHNVEVDNLCQFLAQVIPPRAYRRVRAAQVRACQFSSLRAGSRDQIC